jgi:hypothetical protein
MKFKPTITLKGHRSFLELPLALPVGFTNKNATDANLTPTQRVWKRRRARWQNWKNSQMRGSYARKQTWQDAVNTGTERAFLKREGECD